MKIGDREIGPGNPVFIVAEISGSHLGSLKNAHRLIDYAASTGADAVKLQTYEPGDLTTQDAPAFTEGPWKGMRPWDLYERSHTPRAWHKELFDHAHERGMVAFSSPFSPEAVEFLETIDCPAYKVASLETGYGPLLEAIRETGKPVMISMGAGSKPPEDEPPNYREVLKDTDVTALVGFANGKLIGSFPSRPTVLMHCVSAYPTPIARASLGQMIQSSPNALTGLSDHSHGFLVPVLAVALGAYVIEKHIRLPDDHSGPDAAFAMIPEEFENMVLNVRLAEQALESRDNSEIEAPMRALRRREINGQWLRVSS